MKKFDIKKLDTKNKIVIIVFVILLVASIIGGLIYYFFNGKFNNLDDKKNTEFIIPHSYTFSGTILSSAEFDGFKTVVEFNKKEDPSGSKLVEGYAFGDVSIVILQGNIKTSSITLQENIYANLQSIDDYSLVINDYNNDKNMDFAYAKKIDGNENYYKIYSISAVGEISTLEVEGASDGIKISSKKNSLSLIRTSETKFISEYYDLVAKKYIQQNYEWEGKKFALREKEVSALPKAQIAVYYDGYKIDSIPGEYKLESKNKDTNTYKVTKDSKLSLSQQYKAIPNKIEYIDSVPKEIDNSNDFVKAATKKETMKANLDSDNKNEFIVLAGNKVFLFDSQYMLVDTLAEYSNQISIKDVVDIADIDNDGTMEIVIKTTDVTVSVYKYKNGFLYGEN